MKTYKIVAKAEPGNNFTGLRCKGCLFDGDDGACLEPMELDCFNNIWILEEIDETECLSPEAENEDNTVRDA